MSNATIQTPASWDTGTVAKPGPMMVVNPERQVADEQLDGLSSVTGLNGPFVADLLASCATHERCGVNLSKTIEARSGNPAAKKTMREFQDDALQAVHTWENVASVLGVPVIYASPPARVTEAMDTAMVDAMLLTGAADQMTIELKAVEAVMLAATLCVANAATLASLSEGLDDSAVKDQMAGAAAELRTAAESHLEWAVSTQQQMIMATAKANGSGVASTAAQAVVDKVRDVIGR